jgi:hypothetical protein
LDGTYTEAVLKTNFTERSVIILSSWIGDEYSEDDAVDRGLIVGQAVFNASFKMKINIAHLIAHIELIEKTFENLMGTAEPEVVEKGMVSKFMAMDLTFTLLAAILMQMRRMLAELLESGMDEH